MSMTSRSGTPSAEPVVSISIAANPQSVASAAPALDHKSNAKEFVYEGFTFNLQDVREYFVSGIKTGSASKLGRTFNNAKPPQAVIAAVAPIVDRLFAGVNPEQNLLNPEAFVEWGGDRPDESPFTAEGEFQPELYTANEPSLPTDKPKRDAYLAYIKSLFQQARALIIADEATLALRPWLTDYFQDGDTNWLEEARNHFSEEQIRKQLVTGIALCVATAAKESIKEKVAAPNNPLVPFSGLTWQILQRQEAVVSKFLTEKAKLEKTLHTLESKDDSNADRLENPDQDGIKDLLFDVVDTDPFLAAIDSNTCTYFERYAKTIYAQCDATANNLEKNPCTSIPVELISLTRLINNIYALKETNAELYLTCVAKFNIRYKELIDRNNSENFMVWAQGINEIISLLIEYKKQILEFNAIQSARAEDKLNDDKLVATAAALVSKSIENLPAAKACINSAKNCVNKLATIRHELNNPSSQEYPLLHTIGQRVYDQACQLSQGILAELEPNSVSLLDRNLARVTQTLFSALKTFKFSDLNARVHSNTLTLHDKYNLQMNTVADAINIDQLVNFIAQAEQVASLIQNAKKLEDQLEKYKQALDAAAFNLNQEHEKLYQLRKQQVDQLLKNPDLTVAGITELTITLKTLTTTVEALTALEEEKIKAARDDLNAQPVAKDNPILHYTSNVCTEGWKHAHELLQQPQIDIAYQGTFNDTLRDTTTVIENRDNLANASTAITTLDNNAANVQGASVHGKKFWFAVGQLVVGFLSLCVGVAFEAGLAIVTHGVSIALGGTPVGHTLIGGGAGLMATGAATLWSNRQKSYSKAVSNIANAAAKAKAAAPKPVAAKPNPIDAAIVLPPAPARKAAVKPNGMPHLDVEPKPTDPLLGPGERDGGSPASDSKSSPGAASTTDTSSGSGSDKDDNSRYTPPIPVAPISPTGSTVSVPPGAPATDEPAAGTVIRHGRSPSR